MRVVILVFLLESVVHAQDGRPNILLFIGDNWSYPHASILGDTTAKTPVFDRIAKEGALFAHCFCPVPSCSPTRSSLLTGRAAHQLEDAASLWSTFPRKLRVFTDMLSASGYEVGYTGKGWSPGIYKELGWSQNPAGKEYKSFQDFMVRRDQTKPFFFWNGNVDTALHRWRYEEENPSPMNIPAMLPDTLAVRQDLAAYYNGVSRMDAEAGQCVDELTRSHTLDQTMVVYTSDNGWQMPRGLANCYDTGTRVPLAIRWPSKVAAGSRQDAFVCLNDLAPTFLETAGVPVPPDMTAKSFLDLLTGKPRATTRDAVFLERERHANVRKGDLSYPIRGIRTKDYLYLWNMRPDRWPAGDPKVYYAVGDYGDVDGNRAKDVILAMKDEPNMKKFYTLNFDKRPEEELYDLRTDPDQLINLAGSPQHAEAKAGLKTRVQQWMRDTADPRVDPGYDEWDRYPYYGGRVVDENGNPIPKGKRRAKGYPKGIGQ